MALLEPLYPIQKHPFEMKRTVCLVMLELMRDHIDNEELITAEDKTTKSILIEVHNTIGKKLNQVASELIKLKIKTHEAIALQYFLTHHAQCHASFRIELDQVAGKLQQAL